MRLNVKIVVRSHPVNEMYRVIALLVLSAGIVFPSADKAPETESVEQTAPVVDQTRAPSSDKEDVSEIGTSTATSTSTRSNGRFGWASNWPPR